MASIDEGTLRRRLEERKRELAQRLERITENVRRGYHPDSKERAKEMEDAEVVDALGNETRRELGLISNALQRMDAGDYGSCTDCGNDIDKARLDARPYAEVCIDCARAEEQRRQMSR